MTKVAIRHQSCFTRMFLCVCGMSSDLNGCFWFWNTTFILCEPGVQFSIVLSRLLQHTLGESQCPAVDHDNLTRFFDLIDKVKLICSINYNNQEKVTSSIILVCVKILE